MCWNKIKSVFACLSLLPVHLSPFYKDATCSVKWNWTKRVHYLNQSEAPGHIKGFSLKSVEHLYDMPTGWTATLAALHSCPKYSNKQITDPSRQQRNAELVSLHTYSYVNRVSVFQECALPTGWAGLMLDYRSRIPKHGYFKCIKRSRWEKLAPRLTWAGRSLTSSKDE